MIRHIFIGVIKEGVPASKINERLEVMKGLKDAVPFVKNFAVGRNLGWFTPIDSLVLTADFDNKEKWEEFINSDYHMQKLGAVAGEVFDMEKSSAYQFEY
ncbi:MAG: Dabb family protein [Muribaculaceae bacterium]|nr:Dabb family protein [Muribaculaceae bacterium]